jgi:hypothetical protein
MVQGDKGGVKGETQNAERRMQKAECRKQKRSGAIFDF